MRLTLHLANGETARVSGVQPQCLDALTNALQVGSSVKIKGDNRTIWVNPRHVATASLEGEES